MRAGKGHEIAHIGRRRIKAGLSYAEDKNTVERTQTDSRPDPNQSNLFASLPKVSEPERLYFSAKQNAQALKRLEAIPATVTNDAELLLYRCGKPDRDDSTENDNPRPQIPSRIIDYRKARLRFAYLPSGETQVSDPPPYKWKFFGIVDLRTNKAISAAQLESVLSKRMPCFLARKIGWKQTGFSNERSEVTDWQPTTWFSGRSVATMGR